MIDQLLSHSFGEADLFGNRFAHQHLDDEEVAHGVHRKVEAKKDSLGADAGHRLHVLELLARLGGVFAEAAALAGMQRDLKGFDRAAKTAGIILTALQHSADGGRDFGFGSLGAGILGVRRHDV